MTECPKCDGYGRTNEDAPHCYRPDNLCKWDSAVCEQLEPGDFCTCESKIITCGRCEGSGVILSPLEKLAEQAE